MTDSAFDAFVESFGYFGTTTFNKLNLMNIYSKRYIMMPINPKDHWFLLVINPTDKYIHHWNSIGHSPNYPKVADYTAGFYSRLVVNRPGSEICPEARWVDGCLQQEGNDNSGVFVYMWAYWHAVDNEETREKAKICSMKKVRAKIAIVFLKHQGVDVDPTDADTICII